MLFVSGTRILFQVLHDANCQLVRLSEFIAVIVFLFVMFLVAVVHFLEQLAVCTALSVFGTSLCSLVGSLLLFLYLVIESVDYYLLEQILSGFTFLDVFVPFAVLVFFLIFAVCSGLVIRLWSLSTSLSSLKTTSWSSTCTANSHLVRWQ